MSRSGYSDDCDNLGLYRATVQRAISGKRGQAFLQEMADALDAMPEKALIAREIVGGESGPKARIFDLAHARKIRDACREAGVSFFFKQAGSNPIDSDWHGLNPLRLSARSGDDPDEWPADLRVHEFPITRGSGVGMAPRSALP